MRVTRILRVLDGKIISCSGTAVHVRRESRSNAVPELFRTILAAKRFKIDATIAFGLKPIKLDDEEWIERYRIESHGARKCDENATFYSVTTSRDIMSRNCIHCSSEREKERGRDYANVRDEESPVFFTAR